jgi:hypothetical protein
MLKNMIVGIKYPGPNAGVGAVRDPPLPILAAGSLFPACSRGKRVISCCLKGRRFAQINAKKHFWLDGILKICVHLRPDNLVFYCFFAFDITFPALL